MFWNNCEGGVILPSFQMKSTTKQKNEELFLYDIIYTQ